MFDKNGIYYFNPTMVLYRKWLKVEVGIIIIMATIFALVAYSMIPSPGYVVILFMLILAFLGSGHKREKYNQQIQIFCDFCKQPLLTSEEISICVGLSSPRRGHDSCLGRKKRVS